jgi:hypothetical protein
MAAPTGAHVVRDAVVTLATVEYANQVRIARLVPDTPIQTYRTSVPDGAVQDVDSPVWTFELTGLQINVTNGLAKALRAAAVGSTMAVILTPHDAVGEDSAEFNILVVPPPLGGTQGEFMTMEMVFPVIGQPVFEPVAA